MRFAIQSNVGLFLSFSGDLETSPGGSPGLPGGQKIQILFFYFSDPLVSIFVFSSLPASSSWCRELWGPFLSRVTDHFHFWTLFGTFDGPFKFVRKFLAIIISNGNRESQWELVMENGHRQWQ